jgi:hypothetical protein
MNDVLAMQSTADMESSSDKNAVILEQLFEPLALHPSSAVPLSLLDLFLESKPTLLDRLITDELEVEAAPEARGPVLFQQQLAADPEQEHTLANTLSRAVEVELLTSTGTRVVINLPAGAELQLTPAEAVTVTYR